MKKYLSTAELRKLFIEYFQEAQHTVVPSSALVPVNDPSLLFTNAGMVQFKNTFLGKEPRPYTRAVSVQRCLRASGKHNDLENVGYTTRHHTFFEMLGNFSFGDYFKREAIKYAWDFLTKELKIPANKLWVTVHQKDDEAAAIWLQEIKVDPKLFSRCGDKDNFWAMGEVGPCGYCSEIYYDHGANLAGAPPGTPEEGGERYVEIWNLVFMQFERDKSGQLTPLSKPCIDTGMGLERIAAVMQGVHDNYEIDIFQAVYRHFEQEFVHINGGSERPEFAQVNEAPGQGSEQSIKLKCEGSVVRRIIADHIRSSTFLIADGVLPANEGRGYVLRSIMRRAIYHLYQLGVRRPVFFGFVRPLIEVMADAYPELNLHSRHNEIAETIRQEEIKFLDTLERGIKILDQELMKITGKVIPGNTVFTLHDTYGFPAILTEEIARQRGLTIDRDGYHKAMEKQREQSREASKFGSAEGLKLSPDIKTRFIGYSETTSKACIIGLFNSAGAPVEALTVGETGIVLLDVTPFYAESGGQVGDSGEISWSNGQFTVHDTKKDGSAILHYGVVSLSDLNLCQKVMASIDVVRRQAIKLNHSAAHLLHKTLGMVLGEHALQRGSMVDGSRLRFDFTNSQALTSEDITLIETEVNRQIRNNLVVTTEIKSLAEAQKEGVVALFGEKYGEVVRVVKMGDFSQELCGGTHVNQTGDIGFFKILAESAVAAGVRRIEAVTGDNAVIWTADNVLQFDHAAALLKANREQLAEKIAQLLAEKSSLEKTLQNIKMELATYKVDELVRQTVEIGEIKVLAATLENVDGKMLRLAVDQLKQKFALAVVLLACVNDNKISVVAGVTSELAKTKKISAHDLVQSIAAMIDGSGGGRSDMAQGGGTNVTNLSSAINSVVPWVKNRL